MAIPELTLTDKGHELQFAINHLGHFALTVGLYEALAAGSDARVVSVSSTAHLFSPVVFDDLHFSFRDYTPFSAYGQSKTANVLFAVGAHRRWRGAGAGITANALSPGGIATRLQRHVGGESYMKEAAERYRRAGGRLKSVEQGAATSVLLATAPQLEGVGGRYFEDNNEARVVHSRNEAGAIYGVAPYGPDPENANRLWKTSLRLIA